MPPKGTIKGGAGLKTREANEEESSAEYRGGCPKNGTKMKSLTRQKSDKSLIRPLRKDRYAVRPAHAPDRIYLAAKFIK